MRCLDKQSQKNSQTIKSHFTKSTSKWSGLTTQLEKKPLDWEQEEEEEAVAEEDKKKLLVVNISQTTTDVLKNRSIFFSQWSVQIRHKSYRFLLPRDGCSSLKACQELLQLFDACCAETRSEVLLIREQFCCAPGVAFATFASLALDWSEAGRQLFLLASYLS